MSELNLEKEFEKMQYLLEDLKLTTKEKMNHIVYSKGPYYDFPVFSYQRSRMQRGRIIKNIGRTKNYNDVRFYIFDLSGKIICYGWDGVPDASLYNTFYQYSGSGMLFLSYTYGDRNQPLNVTSYDFFCGKLICLKRYGLYGVSEEKYFYNADILKRIDTCSHGHESTAMEVCLSEHFLYDEDGVLKSINLAYPSGDCEIIYERDKSGMLIPS